MSKLLLYTREPIDNVYYDPRLAYSIHIAVSKDAKDYIALNHNSGILFAKATENSDGSLNPKCLKNPRVTLVNSKYVIRAVRTDGEGGPDAESLNKVIVYSTDDFITYDEIGFEDISADFDIPFDSELLKGTNITDIQGIIPQCIIDISDDIYTRLILKFTTAHSIRSYAQETITASCAADLIKEQATVEYSDKTTSSKPVDWDLSPINWEVPGEYSIKGTIKKPHFGFPQLFDRADPCIGKWNNKYYFIATNDADQNHTLYIREADTIEGLMSAEEHLILDSSTYDDIGGLLWAPEFHIINDTLYIFHACTPDPFFEEESHIMMLKEGGNPIKKGDWTKPKRVVRKDGTDICEAGKEITLDMTEFEFNGKHYVIWSQRQFLPKDLGAWLYIAELNPEKPWMLASDPIVLSKPDYGWGNNHTFVEEGPFALKHGGKLFITFSAAAVDTSYVVGLLSINDNEDPLVVSNWTKKGYPILTSRSVEGEFGTGHNAYIIDEDGLIWNTYHARPGTEGPRSSGIRRVHFDIDGEPVLDMTEELDLSENLREVKTVVIVK
ncbi:MAG: family 43 glycosylhydrolase [Lachnospiraceae bacterium]|nr:family 43 glycosylhydrolase [Lachnospiraceae bacterium]